MRLRIFGIIGLLLSIAGCNGGEVSRDYKDYHPGTGADRRLDRMDSIVTGSQDSIVIYGDKKNGGSGGGASGLANSYLWKASIEAISFMPLVSSDSNGGIIITDWYSSAGNHNEKFKFTIVISSADLQLNSIKVIAFKQVYIGGAWKIVDPSKELSSEMEDKILNKAVALKAKSTKK